MALERLDTADVRQPSRRGTLKLKFDQPLLRGASQRVHLAGADDVAVVDDRDALADVLDKLELVAREEDSRTTSRLTPQNLGEGVNRDRVEPGERLVKHEQVRFMQERSRELGALLVAVRELLEPRVGAVGEIEALEPPLGGRPRGAIVQPVEAPEVGELLADTHPRIEAALLGHVTELHPFGRLDGLAVPEHLARVELDETEHCPHRRRLPCPVRAEEAKHPPTLDRERAVVERLHCPEPLVHVGEAEQHSSQSADARTERTPRQRVSVIVSRAAVADIGATAYPRRGIPAVRRASHMERGSTLRLHWRLASASRGHPRAHS